MRFKLLIILLFAALGDALGQGNSIYGVAPMPVCWTTPENIDSNLIAYWILSGREAAPRVVSYIEADGTLAVVSGGTLQNGFCCCNSSQDTIGITINGDTLILVQNGETYTYIGGGGADDDWRWVDPGADETMYEAIYRMGKISVFTEDTTHAVLVDSTYRFMTDGSTSFFEWLRGTEGFVDYKTLMFRAPGGATGAPQNDANTITIARTNATTTRTQLGNLKFAAPYTGGGGAYRVGAMINAVDDTGGNDTTSVFLDFWTRQQGESFMRQTFTIQGDGRVELDRYNLFQDGIPSRILGYTNTDKDVSVHDIDGNAQPGHVLGIKSGENRLEWLDPDTLGAVVPTIFTGGTFGDSSIIDMQNFSLNFVNAGSWAFSNSGVGVGVPVSGGGNRIMWVSEKYALRAGAVNNVEWNDANIGVGSFATGENNTASGDYSGAIGSENTTSGYASFATGELNEASGDYSFVTNDSNTGSGYASFVSGESNIASGDYAHVVGGEFNESSGGYGAIIAGRSNTESSIESSVIVGGNGHTLSGGRRNIIAGGDGNTIQGGNDNATLGGDNNVISATGSQSAIIGGQNNELLSNGTIIGSTSSSITINGGIYSSNNSEVLSSGVIIGSNRSDMLSNLNGFIAGGTNSICDGQVSAILGGQNNRTYSFSETALGLNGTVYSASSTSVYFNNDRLITIGNGTDSTARSSAMIIYKGGVGAAKTYINPGTSTTVPTETLRIGGTTRADGVVSVNNGATSAGQIVVAEDSDDGANTATITLSGALAANTTFPIPANAPADGSILRATSATTATWEAVQSDTVVLNSTWVNIGANKLRVHRRNGLVSIQGFIRGATIGTTLPGSPDAELPFGGFLVSNGFQCVANDDGVLKAVAVQDVNGDLSFQSLSGGSIDLSGGSDYLFFSITYYNP